MVPGIPQTHAPQFRSAGGCIRQFAQLSIAIFHPNFFCPHHGILSGFEPDLPDSPALETDTLISPAIVESKQGLLLNSQSHSVKEICVSLMWY